MSSILIRRCIRSNKRLFRAGILLGTRSNSSQTKFEAELDTFGIPSSPTWSVNDLLSSYPTPTITPTTLNRLHELSALIAPVEGTQAHDTLKGEMEQLIRLVEAVKLVDLSDTLSSDRIPDGRIWEQGTGVQPVGMQTSVDADASGSALLRFANRTSDGLYVVDADRTR